MGVEVLDSAIEAGFSVDDTIKVDSSIKADAGIDARRRLEDKLEEMRLRRELREYDFDI